MTNSLSFTIHGTTIKAIFHQNMRGNMLDRNIREYIISRQFSTAVNSPNKNIGITKKIIGESLPELSARNGVATIVIKYIAIVETKRNLIFLP
jgi:hypothetical protein